MFKVNSKLLRKLLFERGWTMKELAEAAGLGGTGTVSRMVKGLRVNFLSIGKVAKALNIDPEKLIIV